MVALALLLVALGLLALPGLLLHSWALRRCPGGGPERLICGIGFGLALGICGVYLLCQAGLGVALVGWGLAALTSAVLLARPRPRAALRAGTRGWGAAGSWLLAVLAGAALVRLVPAFLHEYPRGWDPWFHLLLAEKIRLSGALIADWRPFEEIPLNYPTGSHALLALLGRATQVPLHQLFKLLLGLAGVLTCAQVHALCARATGDRWVGLFAAAAWAFLPQYGSLGYYRWGGLPNLLGFCFVLAALATLAGGSRRPPQGGDPRRWLLPVFFVAAGLVNHHVLFCAALALAAVLAALALGRRRRAWTLLVGAALAAGPVGLHLWPRLSAGYKLEETGMLSYGEPAHSLSFMAGNLGYGFLALLLPGLVLALRRRRGDPRDATPSVDRVLWVSLAALLLLFVGFEYGGRALMLRHLGRDIAPFTASRFLTDAVALAAVFPGLLLARLAAARRGPWTPALLLGLVLLLGLENLPLLRSYAAPVVRPEKAAAYRFIRHNTTPETVVLDRHVHAPYLCWRAASNTPLPSSELWARAEKHKTMAAVLRGNLPPALLRAPVVLVSGIQRGKLLWRSPSGQVKVSLIYQNN